MEFTLGRNRVHSWKQEKTANLIRIHNRSLQTKWRSEEDWHNPSRKVHNLQTIRGNTTHIITNCGVTLLAGESASGVECNRRKDSTTETGASITFLDELGLFDDYRTIVRERGMQQFLNGAV